MDVSRLDHGFVSLRVQLVVGSGLATVLSIAVLGWTLAYGISPHVELVYQQQGQVEIMPPAEPAPVVEPEQRPPTVKPDQRQSVPLATEPEPMEEPIDTDQDDAKENEPPEPKPLQEPTQVAPKHQPVPPPAKEPVPIDERFAPSRSHSTGDASPTYQFVTLENAMAAARDLGGILVLKDEASGIAVRVSSHLDTSRSNPVVVTGGAITGYSKRMVNLRRENQQIDEFICQIGNLCPVRPESTRLFLALPTDVDVVIRDLQKRALAARNLPADPSLVTMIHYSGRSLLSHGLEIKAVIDRFGKQAVRRDGPTQSNPP